MSQRTTVDDLLYCDNVGNTTSNLRCCYNSQQGAPICQENFNTKDPPFLGGCTGGNCILSCQNRALLYSSEQQENPYMGNGVAPIRRYLTCVNLPAVAGYYSQDVLTSGIKDTIGPFIPNNTSSDDLKGITLAVTECLTFTCRNARDRAECQAKCSAVNLLTNNTSPNLEGVNGCLESLCTGDYKSLPFADADIVGIGVFSSYIMQCILVALLCFGLFAFDIHARPKRRKHRYLYSTAQPTDESSTTSHQDEGSLLINPKNSHLRNFENFLVDFHKAQCYFSSTLQIASLSTNILTTNMLLTFMLTPLASNGILPIVFAYVLLYRCRRASPDVTLLTLATWILSTIVYWILYAQMIPINGDIKNEERKYRAYEQFMYKLSAIDACGGYSALAVCPENFELGKGAIVDESHKLRILTPIIWSFSTACLFAVLLGKVIHWWHGRRAMYSTVESGPTYEKGTQHGRPTVYWSYFGGEAIYWLTALCFLVGICMQLSLLSIGTSLNMMNQMHWSFGQIVAVTIWVPPLLGWVYNEGTEIWKGGQSGE
ncbi:hypothetical protein CC78DRAFT_616570 [Lojkania enalia]|uniref:Uncharacterized protein n=1 Tax=Lojkania enalia TaxID=147567 RepID=A0A9P4K8P2_9PLEO|nr:hypothetical protein CC78DRAFT_616570 [Didymosphaeria enalia]